MVVAGRGVGHALLGSSLLVGVTVLGGAGGYGVGLWTTTAKSEAATGPAVPLAAISPSAPPSSTPPPSQPVKTAKPDDTPPLRVEDLSYKSRQFTVEQVLRSRISVKVPKNWKMTQPDPADEARFSDPASERYIRIEAGFTIQRPPSASMAELVATLKALPADQVIRIVSEQVDATAGAATLVYTWIPQETLRFVLVRWTAVDKTGNAAVEMSITGLPQDREALTDVLDHATDSVTRTDSPL